jgi:hypothetical protein
MGRLLTFFIFLCAILVAAFLLNSPVAFATKLPTVCNIFNKTQIEKSGPCGNQATFSKLQSLEEGAILVSEAGTENCGFIGSWSKQPSFLSPYATIPNSFPLRC